MLPFNLLEASLFILILFPFLAAFVCLFCKQALLRKTVVIGTCTLVMIASLALLGVPNVSSWLLSQSNGVETLFGVNMSLLIERADFLLLFFIFAVGVYRRHVLVITLSLLQIILLFWFEHTWLLTVYKTAETVYIDSLATTMVLIISIIGSLICLNAIPYMETHERHQHLEKTKQPRFFAILLVFLGAMNGLVLINNFMYFYFFFEATTVCSFLLIGHDGTTEAKKNSMRALWMNSLGGLALLGSVAMIFPLSETLDMQEIISSTPGTSQMIIPLILICLASFTKSAQLPFQSWLLGAMVAPTPTSALLHSSTMVKAGVYLALRFSLAFHETFIGMGVTVFGAFVFLAAALLAVSQSNAKKVLAYSTVSNLGLIFACAGIGTTASIIAGMFLIIFHAISKAMMFLCVGTIEQEIGSREIENMRGLFLKMPVTTVLTVFGIISIVLPPFGMLMGKWMVMELAAKNLVIITMLALGSALSVYYWIRWVGNMLSEEVHQKNITAEKQPFLTQGTLLTLGILILLVNIFAPFVFNHMIKPFADIFGTDGFDMRVEGLMTPYGSFVGATLFASFFVGLLFAFRAFRTASRYRHLPPYMSCINVPDVPNAFRGPMDKIEQVKFKNYYLGTIFTEPYMTVWLNAIALAIFAFVLGGGVQILYILKGGL